MAKQNKYCPAHIAHCLWHGIILVLISNINGETGGEIYIFLVSTRVWSGMCVWCIFCHNTSPHIIYWQCSPYGYSYLAQRWDSNWEGMCTNKEAKDSNLCCLSLVRLLSPGKFICIASTRWHLFHSLYKSSLTSVSSITSLNLLTSASSRIQL